MNLVKLQDTKLIHRNLLHSYTLTMKEKLRKQSYLPSHQKKKEPEPKAQRAFKIQPKLTDIAVISERKPYHVWERHMHRPEEMTARA